MLPLNKEIKNSMNNMKLETITNENGTAIKFSDGTMIQYGAFDTNERDFTTEFGSVFYNNSYFAINFPLEFIGVPIITVNEELGGYLGGNILGGLPSKSNFRVYLYTAKSATLTRNATIYWQAIGRWK